MKFMPFCSDVISFSMFSNIKQQLFFVDLITKTFVFHKFFGLKCILFFISFVFKTKFFIIFSLVIKFKMELCRNAWVAAKTPCDIFTCIKKKIQIKLYFFLNFPSIIWRFQEFYNAVNSPWERNLVLQRLKNHYIQYSCRRNVPPFYIDVHDLFLQNMYSIIFIV